MIQHFLDVEHFHIVKFRNSLLQSFRFSFLEIVQSCLLNQY
ncbi:unnamed protein product [Meloidogyne enterolobii]|uniref:Uncharacterized protein n=1 Tax=Meloidogyne enterolobii TaxID=390850 RepID=A0ACB1ADP6_MELEN